jgi:hypothetical protein
LEPALLCSYAIDQYCIRLSGWMRIGTWSFRRGRKMLALRLHPAFGLDEDWN